MTAAAVSARVLREEMAAQDARGGGVAQGAGAVPSSRWYDMRFNTTCVADVAPGGRRGAMALAAAGMAWWRRVVAAIALMVLALTS